MGLVSTALSALAVIAGFTGQNIFIVYWLERPAGSTDGISAFAVLLLCGCVFAVFFPLCALVFAVRTGDWSVFSVSGDAWESRLLASPFRPSGFRLSHAQTLAAAGVCNALNGILIVYASSPTKTPPLIQAILQNCGVLFSVPFSKLALRDSKVYCAPEPLRAAGVVVASVVVSLLPTVLALAGSSSGSSSSSTHSSDASLTGWSTLAWVLVYTAGLAPNALLNILQQLYFIRVGALTPGAASSSHSHMRGTLRALMFSNLWQPITYAALFWVDLLPWFGYSASLGDFAQGTSFSLACSIGGPALAGSSDIAGRICAPATPLWAWAFLASYILAYFGGAQLNRESATFNMLCLVIVTASTALVWLIPGVNPSPSSTPLWSVLVSLLLALTGSLLWKAWESKTPPEEQFEAIYATSHALGGGEGAEDYLLPPMAGRSGTFDGASSLGAWSARESHAESEYGEGGEQLLLNASTRSSGKWVG